MNLVGFQQFTGDNEMTSDLIDEGRELIRRGESLGFISLSAFVEIKFPIMKVEMGFHTPPFKWTQQTNCRFKNDVNSSC